MLPGASAEHEPKKCGGFVWSVTTQSGERDQPIQRDRTASKPYRTRRQRIARSAQTVAQAEDHLRLNNHTKNHHGITDNSTRKLGQKLEISHQSALRILHDNLGLNPWKKKTQTLTTVQRTKRLERAIVMRERFAGGRHRRILFSDEKYFPIEESYNPQNDRI